MKSSQDLKRTGGCFQRRWIMCSANLLGGTDLYLDSLLSVHFYPFGSMKIFHTVVKLDVLI